MSVSPGTRFGPYEIADAIGAGGMGEVYRARDTRLQRDVALKVLPAALTSEPAARERFLREARAVASLQHPNICTLHDVGETGDGSVFLVMELLHGETALQRAAQGPLGVAALVDAGIALADALETAHAAGIVHRDIKPANVVLTARGPKILDFGVAQMRPAAPASSARTALPDPQLTAPGTAVGTVAYMSPEQLQGDVVDARSDLFSLGLVLFELATGRPAFTGGTTAAIAAAILHDAPATPSMLRPGLPPRIDEVILKALEKDRGLRYQSAAEIRGDLQRVKRDSDAVGVTPPPTSRPAVRTVWRWPAMTAVAALLAVGIAAGAVYLRRPAAVLTDTATLVLADFVNTTGDPVFDDTLRQGLAVQLQQSPFLSLASDQRIRQTLRLMGHAADAPLTGDAAREACERLGGGAMLEGSITSLGTQYVLGLRAERCASGDVLAEEQVQAASKEDVLDALSRAASAFRTRVGESLSTIEQHNRPLEEASTPSLDALKAFSAAVTSTARHDNVLLYKRAVEIDPGFALAHARLGLVYSIIGESELGAQSTSEAYRLRDRATDRERFFITATYQRQVTGNLHAAQRTFETWGEMYPRDLIPPSLSSGFTYKGTGDYEKAIAAATRALTIDPDFAPAHLNLINCNLYLGRFQEARRVVERMVARKVEPPELRIVRYLLAFLGGDRVAMDREVAAAQSDSEVDLLVQHTEALTSARSGQVQRARVLSRLAVERTRRAGQLERAAVFQTGAAVWEAFYGNREGAHQAARDALRVSRGRDVVYGAAFALALTGEVAEAQTLAGELAKRFPEDTSVLTHYLPTLRGLLALQRKDSAAAIVQLEAALPNELGIPATNFVALFGSLYSAYVRGQAFQALGRSAEAVAEFRKILDHSGLVFSDPVGAMARWHLARALAASGDRSGAHAAYQDLLTLWSGADADLPLLRQAKAESAKLP
jgi:tetratricopeptide (TPR) repeat protein